MRIIVGSLKLERKARENETDLYEKRPANETYKRDLYNRHIKETNKRKPIQDDNKTPLLKRHKRDLLKSRICPVSENIKKNCTKRDL